MACVGVLMRAVDTVATQLISAKHATTECGKSCDPPRETSAPLHRQQDSCSPNMLRQLRFRWSFAELPPRPVTTFDCVHCDILLSTFLKKNYYLPFVSFSPLFLFLIVQTTFAFPPSISSSPPAWIINIQLLIYGFSLSSLLSHSDCNATPLSMCVTTNCKHFASELYPQLTYPPSLLTV